jgi:hypothetical protein
MARRPSSVAVVRALTPSRVGAVVLVYATPIAPFNCENVSGDSAGADRFAAEDDRRFAFGCTAT